MPSLATGIQRLKPSVFATLSERMKSLPAAPLPLHIGDTFHLPPPEARLENLELEKHPEFYRYAHPFGQPALLSAIQAKLARENRLEVPNDALQITCGATQALHCTVLSLFDPGQTVTFLAPYWPLFGGMCRSAGLEVQELPVTDRLYRGEIVDFAQFLRSRIAPGARGLYFCNPNNPDGYVYTRAELEAIATVAQEMDLWVISDEVYEHYIYDVEHTSIASLPGMAGRCLTSFSFSKSYAMAGHRLGYLTGPLAVMGAARRAANHTVYNVSPSLQFAGLKALELSPQFVKRVARDYRQSRDILYDVLSGYAEKPPAGGYLFLRLKDEKTAWDLIWAALDKGVALAPGAAFGDDYAHCIRVCFTSAPPEDIARAADVLRSLLA